MMMKKKFLWFTTFSILSLGLWASYSYPQGTFSPVQLSPSQFRINPQLLNNLRNSFAVPPSDCYSQCQQQKCEPNDFILQRYENDLAAECRESATNATTKLACDNQVHEYAQILCDHSLFRSCYKRCEDYQTQLAIIRNLRQ
jgi:hypothetical protein